jgi:membrane associated rhomboid family serine protease
VGTVQVTTTIAAVAMAIISLFFAAASPSFFSEGFWLSWETLRRFQLWRIVTWPLVNSISIWTILSIAVLFLFGREIEARIGKHRFAWMLAAMTLVGGVASAVVFSAYDAPTFVAGIPMGDPVAATAIAGVAELVQGLFLAFVLINPRARSFFGIPLWLFVAVFQLLDILSAVATRNWPQLANILAIDAVVALLVRAFGVTEFEQIPKIPTRRPTELARRLSAPSRNLRAQMSLRCRTPLAEPWNRSIRPTWTCSSTKSVKVGLTV